ncbi:MAG: hypothetical protein DWQ04_06640, partial [Chloroflexi bacterium]
NSINELLQDEKHCGYPADQVKLLTNEQATANKIKEGLSWLADNAGEADTAVIYFSGHGGQIKTGEHADNYLIPYEATATNLPGTAISDSALVTLLNKIQVGRLLVIFDCCHAGGIGDVKGGDLAHEGTVKSGLDSKLYDRLGQGTGRAVIASSRSNEVSWVMGDMPNSLFTHHMLQAFKGEAPMRGDGLVRLFDLFDYVSEHVSVDQPNQHPILKAEIEKNFPIALHLGGQKTIPKQLVSTVYKNKPDIQNFQNVDLGPTDEEILFRMYDGYKRIVIKGEMGGGFGGGRVFLIHPVAVDDGADLPVVVKTGPIGIIEQEWSAFKQFVENKVPHVADIKGDLVYSQDRRWGGIRYPLAGNELYETLSLKSFCKQFDLDEITYVLKDQLFYTMKEMWQKNKHLGVAFVGGSFDPVLPVNVKIHLLPNIPATDTLTPKNCFQSEFKNGNIVAVSGFEIVEIDPEASELTLNLPYSDDDLPNSYRVRFTGVTDMAGFGEGKVISKPLTGVVQTTRFSLIQELVEAAFNDKIDTTATNIAVPKIGTVLNPIPEIPKFLKEIRHVRMGPIHGDLNLENVLVVYDKRNRQVFLIDFANARQDIVLHDFWRMETGIWLYLVPEILKENGRSLSDIPNFVQNIHDNALKAPELEKPFQIISAIRKQSTNYMVKPDDWSEYYNGLIVYLIGALKFSNLDNQPTTPLPKQGAFVTAVSLFHILKKEPMPDTNSLKPEEGDPTMPNDLSVRDLYPYLSKHFTEEDLKDICIELEIRYEDIPGRTLSSKARELLLHLERHGRLDELPPLMKEMRPRLQFPW